MFALAHCLLWAAFWRNASTNGGDASRVGEICCYYLVEFVFFSFIIPTRDASPPLELAFGGSVERWRLVLESIRMATFHWTAIIYKKAKTRKLHLGGFYYTTTTYTPSILHLTLTHCKSLIINTLISVRYYKFYLHTTYTAYMLPHGTSTGGQYHSIGEQKSLLLRQISLRPCGVQSTEYVQTDCTAAGWGV